MIRIGICDDEIYYLKKITKLVEENLKKNKIYDTAIFSYNSGIELCRDKQFLQECQVLFLDINMQDSNGIEIAHQIKQEYPQIFLIFITAHMDYVLMGYRVEAFRFLLKDNLEEHMQECIPALLAKIEKEKYYIRCQFVNGEKNIRVRDILYIESFLHKMYFHMNDERGTLYEKSGSLGELERQLEEYGFCRIHKSYLVNMRLVDMVERYQVRMEDGTEIPIPRDKYQCVREEYFKIMGEL